MRAHVCFAAIWELTLIGWSRPISEVRRGLEWAMPTLQLYPFRFRDPLTGKWVRARHKLQVPEIQRHYVEWEITGAPEIRNIAAEAPNSSVRSGHGHQCALSLPPCCCGADDAARSARRRFLS